MVYKNTIEAILENVKEIKAMVTGFSDYDEIPDIEMDLALEKVRNLYDILLILKQSGSKTNDKIPEQISEPPKEQIKAEKAGSNDIPAETKTSEDMEDIDYSSEHVEPDSVELAEEEPDKTDINQRTVSDRFKSQSTSIHDSLSKTQQYDDLSTKLKSKPIINIADAIGINDKFIFIKELFNDDADKYDKTIEVLNNATNFNDAYNYLMGNFNWDMDNSLVQILLDLIRRKLIINKDE
ncbi:MAG: hypothetical protein JSV22_08995 [Bacteroidales bacterium]|nr:MAG: hypothetical protein JSV22_08995 [Bacteroidales bacterium]